MRSNSSKFQVLGRSLRAPLSNNRGVALMIAIAAVMLIMYFAMEVSYDSNVEYIVNSQGLNRVKAYYAAKSGMQISLLRIKIYQQAQDRFGEQLGSSALLDQIWKFPFAWPLPIPDELNAVDKDNFKKISKESSMDASYFVTIEDEGSKIDLNDLISPSKQLQEATRQQLLNIFEQKKQEDENFAREHGNVRFDELVDSIADWMSPKLQSVNGGDKRAKFSELNQQAQTPEYYPPNRAFRTVAELHFIPGMKDEFYDLLEPRVTIYGMKGINPNLANKEVLKSLDPGMTDEAIAAIIKRRETESEGGPFKCANGTSDDFWNFVQTSTRVRLMGDPKTIPMVCDSVMNFKIRSSGEFAGASREITAIVMDFNKTATKIKSYTDAEKKASDPSGGAAAKPKKDPIPKGPPRIVFWSEK